MSFHYGQEYSGSSISLPDASLAVPAGDGANEGVFSVSPDTALWHSRVGDESYEIIYQALLGDMTPPVISAVTASPGLLWPPNHKMVPIKLTVMATDDVTNPPLCRVVSVTSNEPRNGTGDGNTSSDWTFGGTGPLDLSLRAERAGTLKDRIYTVTVTCNDAAGNESSKSVDIVVPHDLGATKE